MISAGQLFCARESAGKPISQESYILHAKFIRGGSASRSGSPSVSGSRRSRSWSASVNRSVSGSRSRSAQREPLAVGSGSPDRGNEAPSRQRRGPDFFEEDSPSEPRGRLFGKTSAAGSVQLRERKDVQQAKEPAAADAQVQPKQNDVLAKHNVPPEMALLIRGASSEAWGAILKARGTAQAAPAARAASREDAAIRRARAITQAAPAAEAASAAGSDARERGKKRAKTSDQEEAPPWRKRHRGLPPGDYPSRNDTPPQTGPEEWIHIRGAWLSVAFPPENAQMLKAWGADVVVAVQYQPRAKDSMVAQVVTARDFENLINRGPTSSSWPFLSQDGAANKRLPGHANFARMVLRNLANRRDVPDKKVIICCSRNAPYQAFLVYMIVRMAHVSLRHSTRHERGPEQLQSPELALSVMKKTCPKMYKVLAQKEVFLDKADDALNAPEFFPNFRGGIDR